MSAGSYLLLTNAIRNYAISEFVAFGCCVSVFNVYIVIRYISHAVQIYKLHGNRLDADGDGKIDFYDFLIYLQWLLLVIGLFFVALCMSLYYFLARLVYAETKENIFLHLEGQQQVYDNFY